MTKNSILKIVFLFIFSTTNIVAQNKSVNLKSVWENTKNSDSIRFKALADYYILNNQAQPDVALNVLAYYYQLAKEKNNTKELYNVANDRGGIYRHKGELDKSMHYYKVAEELALKLNNPTLKAAISGNIGNVYANKKDYKQALQYFYKSFKIYKNLKEKKGESNMLTNIGSVYLIYTELRFSIRILSKGTFNH
jgi:tetratricopeptide (TPR) repeat protein